MEHVSQAARKSVSKAEANLAKVKSEQDPPHSQLPVTDHPPLNLEFRSSHLDTTTLGLMMIDFAE